MLPEVELVDAKEFTFALMKSPDLIGNHIRQHGTWGALEAALCACFLHERSGVTVLDIGANLGAFTLPIARLLQKTSSTVHSFEPQRIVFQQLCTNVFLNRLDNVFAHNKAVGATCGTIDVPELDFESSTNVGGLSLVPEVEAFLKGHWQHSKTTNSSAPPMYRVDMVSIDSLDIAAPVAFLKVDVEGYEADVFRGCTDTLARNNFPPIFFEVWRAEWNQDRALITEKVLTDLGYDLFRMGDDVVAQHPRHPRYLELWLGDGQVHMKVCTR